MSNDSPDFTVRDILRTLRRQWKIVVGVPLVVSVAAILFSLTLKNTYQAEGTLEVGRVMESPSKLLPPWSTAWAVSLFWRASARNWV
jgi:uncharacterized protein involved in exopolysaccharide biosynthesis